MEERERRLRAREEEEERTGHPPPQKPLTHRLPRDGRDHARALAGREEGEREERRRALADEVAEERVRVEEARGVRVGRPAV